MSKKTRHKASISIFVKKNGDAYEYVVIMDRIGTERGKIFDANSHKLLFIPSSKREKLDR